MEVHCYYEQKNDLQPNCCLLEKQMKLFQVEEEELCSLEYHHFYHQEEVEVEVCLKEYLIYFLEVVA